jgi:hypothetical protein
MAPWANLAPMNQHGVVRRGEEEEVTKRDHECLVQVVVLAAIDAGDERMDTKMITRRLENYLKPDAQQLHVGDGLLAGWSVETREDSPKIPLLYGEIGKALYAVDPDAIHVSDGGRWALLEIEGGGAVTNNRLMKDIVETLLIPQADYLALAVPHQVHRRSPYNVAINLVQAMYGRGIPQQHIRGIMVLGY